MRRLLPLLLLVALALAPRAAPGARVGDLACVLCHPSRDRRAFDVLSATPGMLVGSESAQARVCLSCHNGSVVDHREALGRGGQHPSGFGAGRPLPAPFRTYGANRVECGTCHSPHGQGPGAARWLRTADDGVAPCAGCHPARRDPHLGRQPAEDARRAVERLGGRLGGAGEVVCLTCHAAHGARGPKLLVGRYGPDEDELCRACHAGIPVKGAAPGAPGLACARCHAPHGTAPGLLSGGADGPCLPCHADRSGPGEHPAAGTACTGCHSVHPPPRPGGA
ncbi:MAG: cytochrome c3 family protein, partial [Deferrisomatales bacterium]